MEAYRVVPLKVLVLGNPKTGKTTLIKQIFRYYGAPFEFSVDSATTLSYNLRASIDNSICAITFYEIQASDVLSAYVDRVDVAVICYSMIKKSSIAFMKSCWYDLLRHLEREKQKRGTSMSVVALAAKHDLYLVYKQYFKKATAPGRVKMVGFGSSSHPSGWWSSVKNWWNNGWEHEPAKAAPTPQQPVHPEDIIEMSDDEMQNTANCDGIHLFMDVQLQVFRHMSDEDFARSGLVCKAWLKWSSLSSLWKERWLAMGGAADIALPEKYSWKSFYLLCKTSDFVESYDESAFVTMFGHAPPHVPEYTLRFDGTAATLEPLFKNLTFIVQKKRSQTASQTEARDNGYTQLS